MRLLIATLVLALAACEPVGTRLSTDSPANEPIQQMVQCIHQPELEWCQ
jgi:starvation-inducible outer membrane lipoprotein